MYEQILDKVMRECLAHKMECKTCKYHSLCDRYNITPFGVNTYIKCLFERMKKDRGEHSSLPGQFYIYNLCNIKCAQRKRQIIQHYLSSVLPE